MSGAYSAGTAHVDIRPNLSKFGADMKRKLDRLDPTYTIDVQAKTEKFAAEVKQALTDTEKVATVKVEADTHDAQEKIDDVAKDRSSKVKVDVDVDEATAKVAPFLRLKDLKTKLVINTNEAHAKLAELQMAVNNIKGPKSMVGSMLPMVGMISGLGTAAVGVVGPLAAMGSVASVAAGSLLTVPAAAGAAGFGIMGLMTGLSGIGSAFGAMGQSAGSAAADTSKAVKAAEQAVDDALRGIRDAERGVQMAQRDSADAQKDLNRAREDAVENLKDLNEQLRDAHLDEEGAVLAVARAHEQLKKAQKDPKSSKLDIAESDLAYRKSLDTLEEVRQKNTELAQTVAETNSAGVEGSEQVVQAHQRVEQSQWDEMKAAEALEDAHRRLADAQENLADAGKSAASGGVDPFAEAMAKLSPEAQKFVLAARALGDEWGALKRATQDALFMGLGDSLTTLAHAQLPQLQDGLVGINTELNKGIRESWAVFSTEVAQTDFKHFLGNTTELFAGLGGAMAPLSQLWIDVATVGSDFFPQMGDAVANTATRWSESITEMRESGELHAIIQDGIDAAKIASDAAGSVWGIISNVMSAASSAGQPFLSLIRDTMDEWEAWTGSAEGQNMLVDFFTSGSNALGNVLPILGEVAKVFATGIVPFVEKLTEGAGPGLASMFESLGGAMTSMLPAAQPIGEAVGAIAAAIGKTIEILAPAASLLMQFFAPLVEFLAPVLGPILVGIAAIAALVTPLGIFAGGIIRIVGIFKNLGVVVGLAKAGFSLLWTLFKAHPIGRLVTIVGLLIAAIISAYNNSEQFQNVVKSIGEFLKNVFFGALEWLKTAFGYVSDKVNQAKDAFGRFKDALGVLADTTREKVSVVIETIKDIPKRINEFFSNAGQMLEGIGRDLIGGMLNGLKKKWESVTSWFSNAFGSLSGGSVSVNAQGAAFTPRSVSANAVGSVSAHSKGSVAAFAGGGKENHDPQYAPAGSWRVWAEPETGGELYIPLANDHRRGRAEALLAAGAQHFGLQVIDPATGAPAGTGYQGNLGPVDVQQFAEGGITVDSLDSFARGIQGKPYIWGGVNWGDCTGAQSALANFSVGLPEFGSRFATGNQREELKKRGFTMGDGGPGSFTIGWWNGGAGGGHSASTLPNGVNVEMRGGGAGGLYGGDAIGSNDGRHQEKAHLPKSWFSSFEMPTMGGLNSPDDLDIPELREAQLDGAGDSADNLMDFRMSDAANPDTYAGSGEEKPTTWSGIASEFVGNLTEGLVQDALGVAGISDQLPPLMVAQQELQAAVDQTDTAISGRAKTAAIEGVSDAAGEYLKLNPTADTVTVTGATFADIPKIDPYAGRGQGDIGQEWDPSAGAEQWRDMMVAAYQNQGYEPVPAKIDAWVRQMQSESNGNPNIAQQIVDVNGTGEAAGVGLGQMIPGTWAAYRDPKLPDNRRDPWAMTNAMVRYGEQKYGSTLLDVIGHGHGYATGGDVWGPGGPTDDAIFARLSNGEHVTRTASASLARPLLNAMNQSPALASSLNSAFTGKGGAPAAGKDGVHVHYHIETNNAEEGMRRAQMQARREVMALGGR